VKETNQKCRYYQNCTNPECPYYHPKENCQLFPKCPYGKDCRYIHPDIPCKYGSICQRLNCSYSHPRKIKAPCKHGFSCKEKTSTCGFIHPPELCRYKFYCTRKKKGCPYSHAKLCTYGSECRIPNCSYSHISNLPSQQEEEDIKSLNFSLPLSPGKEDQKDDTETTNKKETYQSQEKINVSASSEFDRDNNDNVPEDYIDMD